jgi:CheY-like chemotaxis protein
MSAAPIRILIIEDDADVRSYLVNLLHAHGYKVTATALAGEGLDLIHNHRPSLVVLDAMLPGDDAQRIYIDLKYGSDLHHIPVILLSTLTRRALWGSRFYGAGTAHKRLPQPEAFLSKPPEAEDFLAAVEGLTTGCRAMDKDGVS